MVSSEQEEKAKEAAAQALKAESIRKVEERLAARERQAVEGESKTITGAEAQAQAETQAQEQAQEEKSTVSEENISSATTATGTKATPPSDTEEGGTDGGVGDTAEVDTVVATATTVVEAADPMTVTRVASAGLPAIEEDFPQPVFSRGNWAAGDENDLDRKRDGEDSQLQENKGDNDPLAGERAGESPAASNADNTELRQQDQSQPLVERNTDPLQSEDALKKAPPQQEEIERNRSESRSPLESAPAETDDSKSQNVNMVGEASPARLELAKQRADIAVLVAHAKEGTAFVSQSVDMAGVLRGFVLTPHGMPVRDPAVKRELLRDGRSTLRDRSELMRDEGPWA